MRRLKCRVTRHRSVMITFIVGQRLRLSCNTTHHPPADIEQVRHPVRSGCSHRGFGCEQLERADTGNLIVRIERLIPVTRSVFSCICKAPASWSKLALLYCTESARSDRLQGQWSINCAEVLVQSIKTNSMQLGKWRTFHQSDGLAQAWFAIIVHKIIKMTLA